MFWHRFRIFWSKYWLWITVGVISLVCIIIPAWYLAGLEENTRRYIMGMNIASLPWSIFQTLFFVACLYLLQFGGGFTRFKKADIKADAIKVRFSDVIGLQNAKREAWEMVQLIKDRTQVKAIGGKIVKGLLMVGPPGCGKTLLAKAIATEAGVPFLSVSGSEFVEVFVGVGASRVRQLFSQARQYAQAYGACIVFIDELEVVGRKRVLYDAFGGSGETNSTQNQLLVEMDGLNDSDANVIVMGATNAGEDSLDQALLRPGRFDRKIYVDRPNLEERGKLFEYYLKKMKYDTELDIGKLARKAVYKTPAEIENIVKEAALIASRNKKAEVSYKEISEAVERIDLGVEHRLNLTRAEREMTAYHEAGHLLVLYLTHPTNDVFKVSIKQRGGSLGVVHSMPKEELYTTDRNSMLAHIRVSLGGYAAERIKYGVTSDGVRGDFVKVMQLAHNMVWKLGMGKSGLPGDYSSIPESQLSESLKEKLNMETQEILMEQLETVDNLLKTEWPLVEDFVKRLAEKEEMDYDEIEAVFTEHGKPPKKAARA